MAAATEQTPSDEHAHPVMNWLDYLAAKNDNGDRLKNIAEACALPSDFPMSKSCYWISNHQFALQDARTTPDLPTEADVVVIGSGMVGATVLYQLSKAMPDVRVVLVEARGICSGATGRNGGHLACHEAGGIRDLAKRVGVDDALRIRKMFRRNRDMMLDVIEGHQAQSKVDLNLGGSLLCFGSSAEREALIADIEFCKQHGWENEGDLISAEEAHTTFGVSLERVKFGAWVLRRGGTFYARKMVDLLITKASEGLPHLNIQTHTTVTQVDYSDADAALPYTLQTSRGNIRARAVVHATNAYARAIIPSLRGPDGVFGVKGHMLGIRSSGDATAADVNGGLLHTHLIHYLLQRPREASGKPPIFLYGHGDAEVIEDFDDSTIPDTAAEYKKEMYEFLTEGLPQYFPSINPEEQVEYDWAGIMGVTNTGCSVVGRTSRDRAGEFLCVGHNGEGMTRCFVLATVTADALMAHLKGVAFERPDWFPHSYARNL